MAPHADPTGKNGMGRRVPRHRKISPPPVLMGMLRERLRPYRGRILVQAGLQFAQTVGMLLLPTLNADIVDKGIVNGDTEVILRLGGIMIGVSLAQLATAIVAEMMAAYTAANVGRDLRSLVFRKVQGFSTYQVGRFGTPSLTNRTLNDVQQLQALVISSLTSLLTAPIICVTSIIMAVRQDPPLSVLIVLTIPVTALVVLFMLARLSPLYERIQTSLDKINQILREQITGVRVIRAFVRDGHEQNRFGQANKGMFAVAVRTGRLGATLFPVVVLIGNLFSIALVWFGGHRIAGGGMQVGSLSAFLGYQVQMLTALVIALYVCLTVPRARVSARRVHEVLTTETELAAPANPVTTGGTRGHLELRGVEYRYPGAQEAFLSGVTLSALPGHTTALVGSTGSGKTTLLNLVLRLADLTAGSVSIDGVDVRLLDAGQLIKTVSLVPQTPYLFTGTVAENLRYGNPEATDAEVWHALEIAQAAEFVRRMPGRLDAPIAQGGSTVSGGQRQRLAIARALLRRPVIYLFDDCFSALDYSTRARLREALATETAGSTVLTVAQEVSLIEDADTIVVLDQGRVVGSGTHTELLRDNETYREIAGSQQRSEHPARQLKREPV
jgi:ATP-binding cassette subfamily B multidrug efflux pump